MSRAAPILAVLLALVPELARACAVCGAGVDDDQSRVAYLVTTASLSALPLALFGGFLLWLRHKARRQTTAQPPPTPTEGWERPARTGSRAASSGAGATGRGAPEPK